VCWLHPYFKVVQVSCCVGVQGKVTCVHKARKRVADNGFGDGMRQVRVTPGLQADSANGGMIPDCKAGPPDCKVC